MANLRQRIAEWLAPPAGQRSVIYTPTITGFGPTIAGATIDPTLAENLATVCACVNAIASGLASLPAYVYRREGDGRIEAPNHPVSRLIRAPNRWQTWPDLLELLMGQVLLWGNALAVIDYDAAGRPTGMTPVPWQAVQVSLLATGQIVYDVVAYQSPWGGIGTPRRYLAGEVFHLKDRGDSPYVGRSRISRAPDVLNAAAGLQTYSTAIWGNAATPSGLVEVPSNITAEGIGRMEAHFTDRCAGANNAKRIMFVDTGTKFTPLSVSPEDAEVLASRRFSGEEIARLFGVPPPIVGDLSHGTFTNSETAGRWFAQFTLAPWARKIEAEFQRSVFSDPSGPTHMEIDLSGLMRGDYAARWAANVAAVQAGILLPDEVREIEGFNPLPAGALAATTGADAVMPGDGGE
jgi:HK97 family phage portal protein